MDIQFILDHIKELAPAFVLLVSLLNATTKHFSRQKGLVKALTYVSEMLSVLTSAGTSSAAWKLKAPVQSVPPKKGS